ncbi:MAG TPA: class I SAM-dependent methyltransferase [Candidatus Angelobacter sp.]
MDTSASYNELASHYHLIFENWEASIDRQAAVLSSILKRECSLDGTALILDCACGIGTQSLGLAKMGFRVTGCDISSKSIERARLEAEKRNLDIRFSVANLLNLDHFGEPRFDAVIRMDNALPHLESAEELNQAAIQIRARLRPGGSLMASIRDYDRLLTERPAIQGPFFYSDEGRRRIVFQVWDWLDDRRYTFHLYITRETADIWETVHTSAVYRVFSVTRLRTH